MTTETETTTGGAEPVLLSALAHYAYCPRRCGLIHIERIFQENVFTLRGRAAHERADEPVSRTETRREKSGDGTRETTVRVECALPLWSERHGLTGTGDVVEFFENGEIVPVEYKNGAISTRRNRPGEIQLCAQALCLEEMYRRPITAGAVYSPTTHRRQTVAFDTALRAETISVIADVQALTRSTAALPPAVNDARCPNCSLNTACLPETVERARQKHHARQLYRLDTEPATQGTDA